MLKLLSLQQGSGDKRWVLKAPLHLGFVAIIPAVLVVVATGALGGAALVLGILVAVPYLALVVVVLTALNAVFQTALYLYATTGSTPTGFADSNLQASFSTR